MSSAVKTLHLLSFFSATTPEIGLSALCRLAKRDKATTHRHLQALEEAGFVEQNPLTRQYRLGPALLQLAQTREQTVPRKESAIPVLKDLAEKTGETTHASVLSGTTVFALASYESAQHSTRVVIDLDKFPLHATASGLSILAFGPGDLFEIAANNLETFTSHTVNSKASLEEAVQSARDTGFGRTIQSFEDEVSSLAAPVFDETGNLAGAVSVACVATRFSPELERKCQEHLITASRDLTRGWGGAVPDPIEAIWAATLKNSKALDSTS
ncbi:IclR family transcriptional regulator [Epibacterium ulvae]|uniref:IclR family transcriptional regulator n=1 Tax=Epibacterium ulvae TaxID=1156985 RepID=UPI0024920216|nr:IclR family transcriptional regulator [Epibacterium ulvae]